MANIDKSDLNGDGVVDQQDLEMFASLHFEEDFDSIDWCHFYESTMLNEKYFRRIVKDMPDYYESLLEYVAWAYGCEIVNPSTDKSDLNGDGAVDLADLAIFSINYLGRHWETVDWCAFHGATIAGLDFEGESTKYYLSRFTLLLDFIEQEFACGAPPPPPSKILLENTPRDLVRIAAAPPAVGGFYVTDPRVGSLFIYDEFLMPKAEIKGLNVPLGVAVDPQGRVLVGNDGRKNVEVYDPVTGELKAVFGQGLIAMPNAITVDEAGYIYVTDSRKNSIKVFDPAYNLVKTIGRAGEGFDELNFPTSARIVTHSVGGVANVRELFVADTGNLRVQVFDLDGNWKRTITFAGTPDSDCSGWGWARVCETPGLPPFTSVKSVDFDLQGRLHVVDSFVASVTMFDPETGEFLGYYGEEGTGPSFLKLPRDMVITAAGNPVVIAGEGGRLEMYAPPQ
jgi:sugar lactone lactonase YvrE